MARHLSELSGHRDRPCFFEQGHYLKVRIPMTDTFFGFDETLRLLKASDVAQILNVSKTFVYKLIRKGELPSVKMLGARRVRLIDLERYISENLS